MEFVTCICYMYCKLKEKRTDRLFLVALSNFGNFSLGRNLFRICRDFPFEESLDSNVPSGTPVNNPLIIVMRRLDLRAHEISDPNHLVHDFVW